MNSLYLTKLHTKGSKTRPGKGPGPFRGINKLQQTI